MFVLGYLASHWRCMAANGQHVELPLHSGAVLREDEPLLAVKALRVPDVPSPKREVGEAPLPVTNLLQVFPKWFRVTRLWFEGEGLVPLSHPQILYLKQACYAVMLSLADRSLPSVYTGKERWQARGWTAAVLVLSLATTLLLVVISYLQRDLDTAMSGKDKGEPVQN